MKEILRIYDALCEANNEIIKNPEEKKINSVAALIKNDAVISLIELRSKNKTKTNRDEVRRELLRLVEEYEADAYVLILDADAMIYTKKNKKTTKSQCVIRTLYTPNEKVCEVAWYKDNELLEVERISGRLFLADTWDAWRKDYAIEVRIPDPNKPPRNDEDISRFKYKVKK